MSTQLVESNSWVEMAEGPAELGYRKLSRAAVASVAMIVLALAGWLFAVMLVVPLLGLLLGLWGWRTVRRFPEEFSGLWLARIGTLANLVILIGATSLHVVTAATEVPEGYQPINFDMLQPDPKNIHEVVPPSALALNGKRVFIKGYIHPSVAGLGPVHQFVLVPDMGTCCFGGQPKLTDMIEVTTPPKQPVRYGRRRLKLAGTLKVDTQLKPVDGLTGVFYQMQADLIQ
ncbi:MAG: hypothetical protein KatS3mg110_4402 [Pirellulaceae bacterium]|nr:MAG: hypothetical protein KatS3mg110_4402 [Pirellulaceae bacterium]